MKKCYLVTLAAGQLSADKIEQTVLPSRLAAIDFAVREYNLNYQCAQMLADDDFVEVEELGRYQYSIEIDQLTFIGEN